MLYSQSQGLGGLGYTVCSSWELLPYEAPDGSVVTRPKLPFIEMQRMTWPCEECDHGAAVSRSMVKVCSPWCPAMRDALPLGVIGFRLCVSSLLYFQMC